MPEPAETKATRGLTIQIPAEIHKALRLKVIEDGTSISAVIRDAIYDYLRK